jgi:hypothetical protein
LAPSSENEWDALHGLVTDTLEFSASGVPLKVVSFIALTVVDDQSFGISFATA